MMKHKILFVKPTNSTFMQVDENILRSAYPTISLCLQQDKGKIAYLMGLLRLKLLLLSNPGIELVVIWFADYHAALAVLFCKILRKKSVTMIGGYDAVSYPEFGYGVYCNKLRAFCAAYALQHTDLIIANHEALLSSDNLYYQPSGHPEGVFRLVPNLHTQAIVIYNSLVREMSLPFPKSRQEQILCVGGTPRYADICNKGYDLLLKVAARRKDWRFVLVGISNQWMQALERDYGISSLTNVIILPAIPHSEVLDLMLNSNVYVQPSISEGMPNALMEAMLCGCLPVGSNVAGIPTVIDGLGSIFSKRCSQTLEKALEQAIAMETDRETISASISSRFSLATRKAALIKGIRPLLKA